MAACYNVSKVLHCVTDVYITSIIYIWFSFSFFEMSFNTQPECAPLPDLASKHADAFFLFKNSERSLGKRKIFQNVLLVGVTKKTVD